MVERPEAGLIEAAATVETLARLGVIILLFEVGLESTVRDMLKVGLTSVIVAVLGVIAPFALGWFVSARRSCFSSAR